MRTNDKLTYDVQFPGIRKTREGPREDEDSHIKVTRVILNLVSLYLIFGYQIRQICCRSRTTLKLISAE